MLPMSWTKVPNVVTMGPPGVGKTLLARALPSILPSLSIDEALDVTKVHSVSGLLPPETRSSAMALCAPVTVVGPRALSLSPPTSP